MAAATITELLLITVGNRAILHRISRIRFVQKWNKSLMGYPIRIAQPNQDQSISMQNRFSIQIQKRSLLSIQFYQYCWFYLVNGLWSNEKRKMRHHCNKRLCFTMKSS